MKTDDCRRQSLFLFWCASPLIVVVYVDVWGDLGVFLFFFVALWRISIYNTWLWIFIEEVLNSTYLYPAG